MTIVRTTKKMSERLESDRDAGKINAKIKAPELDYATHVVTLAHLLQASRRQSTREWLGQERSSQFP
jgi:hypothetical protein